LQSVADLRPATASSKSPLCEGHNGLPEIPGQGRLKDVATHVVFAPVVRPMDRHCIVTSSRVRTAGSLESLCKYEQGLEVCWHVNSELLTSIPKRSQPDRLVDRRIRLRK
jgi:hypothetical protein